MSSLPARLLLWLALLGALWQPLCACQANPGAGSSAATETSCCSAAPERPLPAPCEHPGSACDCEHDLVLSNVDGEAAPAHVRLFDLAALPAPQLELFTLASWAPPRPAPRPAPPRPPGATRLLPLRI